MMNNKKNKTTEIAPSSLSKQVQEFLEHYLKQLEGEDPISLHAIIIESIEKPLLETIMHYVQGNQSRAAKALGLHRNTLRKKLQTYKLI